MPTTPFQTKLLRHDGVSLVEVTGEIDMHTARELDDALAAALGDKPVRLVVDLSSVGFIDSIGLSVLIQNAKLAEAGGSGFSIVCTEPGLLQVFAITGLSDVLTFHRTQADALV